MGVDQVWLHGVYFCLNVVDFNWSGRSGQVYYPKDPNQKTKWPSDRDKPIVIAHHRMQVDMLLDDVLGQSLCVRPILDVYFRRYHSCRLLQGGAGVRVRCYGASGKSMLLRMLRHWNMRVPDVRGRSPDICHVRPLP